MGIWPFGKKKKNTHAEDSDSHDDNVGPSPSPAGDTPADAAAAQSTPDTDAGVVKESADTVDSTENVVSKPHDAVDGAAGPFDGDSVDIETFDFSDFSAGVLDLGSMKVNLPKESQVQVEMGEKGPKMLHIVTRYGRLTPVAFAAPRSQGLWAEAGEELLTGMKNDGLPARLEEGPWGSEVVGENKNGQIRIIGVDGPRWMFRLTLAAPKGREEKLTELGREVAARTFVYRGNDPVLAGNALQVVLPPQLVEQLKNAMVQRQQQAQQAQQQANAQKQKRAPQTPDEEEALRHLRDIADDSGKGDGKRNGAGGNQGPDSPRNSGGEN